MDPTSTKVYFVRTRETYEGRNNPYWGHIGVFSTKEKAAQGIESYRARFPKRKTSFTIHEFPLDAVYDFARVGTLIYSDAVTENEKDLLVQ